MAKAPPSFDYFPGDHIKSCAAMSAEVFGAYWRLQCYQFEHGHIPVFPDERARVAGVVLERWDMIWGRLADKFVPVTDDGKIGHERMAATRNRAILGWEKSKKVAEKRKSAGKKGSKARWQNDSKCHSKTMANLEEGRRKKEGLSSASDSLKRTTPNIQSAQFSQSASVAWISQIHIPDSLSDCADLIRSWFRHCAATNPKMSQIAAEAQVMEMMRRGPTVTQAAISESLQSCSYGTIIWESRTAKKGPPRHDPTRFAQLPEWKK